MPLHLPALPLPPRPDSVRKARAWVRDVLSRLGREDVTEPAELGVSELVTNAILHGAAPLSVRIRGTRSHPRVEVRDGSRRPPEVNLRMTDEEQLLSTVGRGLGLVALNSSAWGADLTEEGKLVWFEPAREPRFGADLSGEVLDLDRTVDARADESRSSADPVGVRILNLPLAPYLRFRQRFSELGRELRLLSLTHGQDYPVTQELTEVFLQTESERRLVRGMEAIGAALAEGRASVDLDLVVPASMPATMARLLPTLERADEFCRDQRLLTLAASPQQQRLQRWYLSEFVRQAAADEACRWPGSLDVEEEGLP